ncbi:unnamed protein product [Kuraishia capsulata CBS 1993]|uniref:Structural maintenance of chromosomes protein 5 n=1 Tax=Kuraishia capsulata CBS 1993 TaxID=1382522 RepID=W6MV95_9ASCO|nr:uncharacterized protein KUCA_T00005831001 [Kuraishia capsulata CBS 1993]CDK29837.1 unnamed protein product [Kuraishia capsulata CBS 1993]
MSLIDLGTFASAGNKRQKLDNNVLKNYAAGSIVRIKLKNFMAYSLTEINPGPSLNMIIGPNGTGKSTFVCAICIGLGGKLKYLGKETMNLDQFIKQGEESGYIETEIAYKGRTILVRRDLTRTRSNAGQWRVDGRDASEKRVQEILSEVNIQLGNLCQFLPQDRVAKFASLQPEELLTEVERSCGKGELLAQHEAISRLYSEKVQINMQIVNLRAEQEQLAETSKSLEEEVSKFEQYEQKKKEMEMFYRLFPYLEVDEAIQNVQRCQDIYKDANNVLKRLKQDTHPLKDRATQEEARVHEIDTRLAELQHSLKKVTQGLSGGRNYVSEVNGEITKIQTQLSSLDETIKTQRAKLVTTKKTLEGYQAELEELTQTVYSDEKVAELKAERQKLQHEATSLKENTEEHKAVWEELNDSMKDAERRIHSKSRQVGAPDRVSLLPMNTHGSVVKAVRALRSFEDQLGIKGKYFEPPCISLQVGAPYRCHVEKSLSWANQNAFTVVDHETYRILSKFLFEKVKVNVSIRTLSRNWRIRRDIETDQLGSYGFERYLIDAISGPKEVKQMLCENDKIHQIPVSLTELTEEQKSRLIIPGRGGRLPFMKFICGREIHNVRRSNYGKRQISSSVTALPDRAKVFVGTDLTEEAIERIQAGIKEAETQFAEFKSQKDLAEVEYRAARDKQKEFDNLVSEIADQLKSNSATIAKINRLRERIIGKENEYKTLKRTIEKTQDTSQQAIKHRQAIQNLVVRKLNRLEMMADLLRQENDFKEEIAKLSIDSICRKNVMASLEKLKEEFFEKEKEFIEKAERAKEALVEAKDIRKKKSQEVRAKAAEYSQEENQELALLAQSLKDADHFTFAFVNVRKDQLKNELALSSPDRASLGKLQENQRRLAEVEARLPNLETQAEKVVGDIKEIRDKWEPELTELISVCSKRFSHSFATVASAGEIRLAKEDEDFSKWRLEILVKFRDEAPLSVLDSYVQSGGEKSVSTALFVNSLQGLTSSPFRVVDEINQGMDARNERLVHKLIVETACESRNPDGTMCQYFLITPKLLTDLYYHANMSVHCVMSGPHLPDPTQNMNFLQLGMLKHFAEGEAVET